MKTCPECGYALAEFDTVCPKCKANVSGVPNAAAAAPAPKPATPPTAPATPAPAAAKPTAPTAATAAKAPAAEVKDEDDVLGDVEDTGKGLKREVKINPLVAGGAAAAAVAVFVALFLWSSRPQGPAVLPPPVMDVPALVGLNIKQIEEKLGKPQSSTAPTSAQVAQGANEGTKTWRKPDSDYSLVVTHEIKTPKVTEFMIKPEKDGLTVREMENAGSVVETDSKYTVEPIEVSGERGVFAGVRVVPAGSAGASSQPAAPAAAQTPAAGGAEVTQPDTSTVTRPDEPSAAPTAPPVAAPPAPAPQPSGTSPADTVTRPD